MKQVLRVFEYQEIKVGERQGSTQFEAHHFKYLADFAERSTRKYFQIGRQSIRFQNYVGVIQVGTLTIEIAPKTDAGTGDFLVWQSVLIDMLKECQLLKVETINTAAVKLKRHSILDIYIDLYLLEVEKLLNEGLLKTYRRREGNLPVLKGRIIVPKQLRKNFHKRDQFWVDFEEYDYQHPLNLILLAGLKVIQKMDLSVISTERLASVLKYFPNIPYQPIKEIHFQAIQWKRATKRYQQAIDIARLLILNFHPDIKSGKNHVVSLLFDMNLLWEEYIYRQLRKLQKEDFQVRRQVQKTFWQRRQIRPDILVQYKHHNIIIDTKWSIPKKGHPKMDALRQIYVYIQYFSAEKGVLIYPKTKDEWVEIESPFFPKDTRDIVKTCQIIFAEVVDNNKLSQKLGQVIFDKLV